MKHCTLLLLIVALFISACNKDDDPRLNADTLHYDGDNAAAPQLPFGEYEASAKFTFSKLERFLGKELYEVNFFTQAVPFNMELIIYGQGDENTPGTVLYNQDLNGINENSWNDITLNNPIQITGEDLWISLKFSHPEDMRSIGCDPGPAENNGDRMRDYSSGDWTNLRDFTSGEVDINWNIRGQVSKD